MISPTTSSPRSPPERPHMSKKKVIPIKKMHDPANVSGGLSAGRQEAMQDLYRKLEVAEEQAAAGIPRIPHKKVMAELRKKLR
jgi:hypothetical protein